MTVTDVVASWPLQAETRARNADRSDGCSVPPAGGSPEASRLLLAAALAPSAGTFASRAVGRQMRSGCVRLGLAAAAEVPAIGS